MSEIKPKKWNQRVTVSFAFQIFSDCHYKKDKIQMNTV